MRALYTLGIHIYGMLLGLATLFVPKAKQITQGRKNIWDKINRFNLTRSEKPLIWIHCASLGEYEMAVPIMERIPNDEYQTALSFYSPSGYEHVAPKNPADVTFYLPLDTPSKMEELVRVLNPSSLVLVKYDFWFNLLSVLNTKGIPFYVVNGLFRPSHFIFSFWGKWALPILKKAQHLFVQNESSKALLNDQNISSVQVVKDIRYQRVLDRKNKVQLPGRLEQFKRNKPILILGSSWPDEEEVLIQCLPLNVWDIIIAPHDVSAKHTDDLRSKLGTIADIKTEFWSEENDASDADILVLDTIGLLASAYALADAAFVGGGFSGKLHNTLEAAVYGIPVATGPDISYFPEAIDLKEQGQLTTIDKPEDFKLFLDKALDKTYREQTKKSAENTFTGLEKDLDDMVAVLLSRSV